MYSHVPIQLDMRQNEAFGGASSHEIIVYYLMLENKIFKYQEELLTVYFLV